METAGIETFERVGLSIHSVMLGRLRGIMGQMPVTLTNVSKQAMHDLCERGAQRVIVTDGRQPTLAFDGREFWRIAPPRIRAVNPIGSGDAFTAGLVWRLLRGDDLGEACRWGCAAGAANALTLMTGEVRRDDVDRLGPEVEVRRI